MHVDRMCLAATGSARKWPKIPAVRMSITSSTTIVVIFSAPMPKSPGGLEVRASDW